MINILYAQFRDTFLQLLFICVMCIPAHAQEELNAAPAIWLVEREDAKLYMLGSVHLLPENIKWYGGKIEEILESAKEVVFEVHLTPDKEVRTAQIVRENGLLENGDVLSNHLDNEEYNYLINTAQTFGIPGPAISSFKPWYASILLSVSAIIQQGWDPESGVDKFIESIAAENNKKISELETVEFQMSTLYDHPLDVQAAMLKDTLEQLQDIKNITLEMVDAWASGDQDRMNVAFLEPMKQQEEIYAKLVVQRNKNWVPVLEHLINKDQVTVVVAGVAHFIGGDGVIAMLEDRGYNVKRVQ